METFTWIVMAATWASVLATWRHSLGIKRNVRRVIAANHRLYEHAQGAVDRAQWAERGLDAMLDWANQKEETK